MIAHVEQSVEARHTDITVVAETVDVYFEPV